MESRITFFEPTNFNVPIVVFNTLVEDAFAFGYVKNDLANLSGLLNHLIPNLSKYRQELHLSFLSANNYDEELTNKIEENIYKIYFNKYDYCDDGYATIPFRVNKEHAQQFLDIVDNQLYAINIDFTGYVRSLLVEYCSKRRNQREYFFYYDVILKIKEAISQGYVCHFYNNVTKDTFVPVSIELSADGETNLIVGYDVENEMAYILPLACVKKVVLTEICYEITDEDSEFVFDYLEQYKKKEAEEECLG